MSKEPMVALDDVADKAEADIENKASYFVADVLSDGVVDYEDEVLFLLAIIECATFHIAQKIER